MSMEIDMPERLHTGPDDPEPGDQPLVPPADGSADVAGAEAPDAPASAAEAGAAAQPPAKSLTIGAVC
jgi:hypothetical protein